MAPKIIRMGVLLPTAVLIALAAAPMASHAIEHAVSGHVNRMIRYADDGKASDIQQLDNSTSQSRIRWRGTGDVGRGMKAGIYIETGVASNNSDRTPIKVGDDPANDSAFTIRHSALFFSGKWGKLTLGQTSQALDGAAEADLSGDGVVNYSESPEDLGGGIAWRTSDGGTISGGVSCPPGTGPCSVIDARTHFDGDRSDVLRYDSPALGPVTLGVAVWNDNAFDVGATIDTKIGGGQLKVRGGYAKRKQRDGFDQWTTSASYLFSQGTSMTMSFGGRDDERVGVADPFNYWFKLGHKWGNNVVTVGGGQTEDLLTKGADGWDIAFSFVHTLPKAGVELYAGYQHQELTLDSTAKANLTFTGASRSMEDVNLFLVGSRIQFN